jgi:PKD domain-containing protein
MSQRLTLGVIAAASIVFSACTVKQSDVASMTGPSALATFVEMSALPDTLVLNGQQSVIAVQAHDATGGPLANLHVHLDVVIGGVATLCGRLTPGDVITDVNGRANAVFTAPSSPLPKPECSGLGSTVTVRAFPVGTDAVGTNRSVVSINLLTPVTSAPANTFGVNFSMSANPASRNSAITFSDAGSVSPGHPIVTYDWSFGDGTPNKTGSSVVHDYGASGTYVVTLTIADDIGQSGSKSGLLTIN